MPNRERPFPMNPLQILGANEEYLTLYVSKLAVQFALAGHTGAASRIVSALNQYNPFNNHSLGLLPLKLLWDELGEWPEGELERVREDILYQRARAQSQSDGDQASSSATGEGDAAKPLVTRQDVRDYVASCARYYASDWNFRDPLDPEDMLGRGSKAPLAPKNLPGVPPEADPERKEEAVKKLVNVLEDRFRQRGRLERGEVPALITALDMKLELEELVAQGSLKSAGEPSLEHILKLIARNFERESLKSSDNQDTYLAQSQRAWRILKNGALAKAMGMDQEKAQRYVGEMEDAVRKRMQNGKEILPDLPMKDIVDQISYNTNNNPRAIEDFEDMGEELPGSLLLDPATAEEIQKTEERLAIHLPEDYKDFARISNGFKSAFSGIITEPSIHRLSEIRWLRDDETYFTELPLTMPPTEAVWRRGRENSQLAELPLVGKVLEIGRKDIDNLWLVPPQKMDEIRAKVAAALESSDYGDDAKRVIRNSIKDFAGRMETWSQLGWTFLKWTSGGAAELEAFPSFKAYLRTVAEESGKNEAWYEEYRFFGCACLLQDTDEWRE